MVMVNSSLIYDALEPVYQDVLKGTKSEWTEQSICIKIKSDPSIFDELLGHYKNSTNRKFLTFPYLTLKTTLFS